MTPRLAALVTLGRELALPAAVLVSIVASGLVATGNTGAVSSPRAVPPIALASADISTASVKASVAVTEPLPAATAAAPEPQPVVTAALTDSSEMMPPVLPLPQDAAASPAGEGTSNGNPPAGSADGSGDCAATSEPAADAAAAAGNSSADADACADRYLWSLYQRAPKQDSVTNRERRTVTVKRKGKLVTVTRTFSVAAEEDFGWKDPKAAETVGMTLKDYVIGGMDRDFKARLARMLRAAEAAGLVPGITSAFRDDYRQSIANGLKAANNRSYHGGSLRGGYGHGMAADIVSVNGATRADRLVATNILWKWVDAHSKEFGIGRPYLGKDPPHVAPIDGNEWAVHRLGKPDQQLASAKPAA